LVDRYIAPKLSHHKNVVICFAVFNSESKVCTHIISTIAFVSVLYSASMLNLETIDSFLALYETRFTPRI
jgi:hypothetical protein